MATVGTFLRSKVARRIVTLFVLCALLPIVCLAIVAFKQVTGELRAASQRRLHEASKGIGMEIFERLNRLETEMTLVESTVLASQRGIEPALPERFRSRLAAGFESLTLISAFDPPRALVGPVLVPPMTTDVEIAHMRAGKSVVRIEPGPHGRPRLLMKRLVESGSDGRLLLAQIDRNAVWNDDVAAQAGVLHVFGPSNELLFTSLDVAATLEPSVLNQMRGSTGELEWKGDDDTYLAHYWSLPLNFDFLGSHWTIVASEARNEVLAPIDSAATTFLLVGLLALWVVMLLSLVQIRRSLVPLTRLQEGTRRLGHGDFDQNVEVTSGDEFEELAGSFNTMARRLKRQFDTLSAMGELDRAVLSSLDESTIIGTVLDRLPQLLECDHLSVILLDPHLPGHARLFAKTRLGGGLAGPAETRPMTISLEDARALSEGREVVHLSRQSDVPNHLRMLDHARWATCVLLPIVVADRVAGVLAVGDNEPISRSSEDLIQARQLVDQIAVALSNAHLVQALDQLNVGTLDALARTVDAKSRWTAGHSQRVTRVAVEIGREMGLAAAEIDALERGGLLHDIGKIAVPSAILNKPSRLTEEEFAIMKQHPRTGARILEPIPEYGRLIPIVLQHHEWFDGRGYPDGLAGEAISVGARVLAVADVFDALTSERPYRPAMPVDEAVDVIRAETGRQFDPRMVQVFLAVLRKGLGRNESAA
jgi:putative nucleotidyltransferase with HDIG domain